MKTKTLTLALAATLSLGTASAFADHTETILGAAIGGATGAAIGHSMGDRGDVMIWSALGGAAGAAIGHSLGERHERDVVVRERVRYYDDGDRYVVVQRPPRVRYVYAEPVRYYAVRPYEREYWHDRGRHRGWHHRDWDDD